LFTENIKQTDTQVRIDSNDLIIKLKLQAYCLLVSIYINSISVIKDTK